MYKKKIMVQDKTSFYCYNNNNIQEASVASLNVSSQAKCEKKTLLHVSDIRVRNARG